MEATRYGQANYKKLLKYIEDMEPNANGSKTHKVYQSEIYLRLVFEYLFYTDHAGRHVFSIAHYNEHNGDPMRDPEITFSVDYDNGTIEPLSYQNDFAGVYTEVYRYSPEGRLYCSKRNRAEIDEFLHMWLKNLSHQDHELSE